MTTDAKGQKLCTTSGQPVDQVRAEQTEETGQHKAYITLCEDERKKGFVRPYRDSYKHVGIKGPDPKNRLIDSPSQPEMKVELAANSGELDAPAERIVRYWTRDELSKVGKGCGTITKMGRSLSETYARDPDFYGATFCVGCNKHLPVAEFVWILDDQEVGS